MINKLKNLFFVFIYFSIFLFFMSCSSIFDSMEQGIIGKWETGIYEGYSTIELGKDGSVVYTEPYMFLSLDSKNDTNIYKINNLALKNEKGTYTINGDIITFAFSNNITITLSFSLEDGELLINYPGKWSIAYDKVNSFGSPENPAARYSDGKMLINSGVFKMEGLGYSDYGLGGNCGFGYDITNKTIKEIVSVRTKTFTINKYPKYGNTSYTFTGNVNLAPHRTQRNFWIILGGIYTFYSSHTVNEVLITFSDGKEYLWVYN